MPSERLPPRLLDWSAYTLSLSGRAARRLAADRLASEDLTLADVAILSALDGGATPQRDVIAALRLDPGDAARTLDGLERRALVQRRRDTGDRRRVVVSRTRLGATALRTASRIMRSVEVSVLEPLDAAERAQLHQLTRRVLVHADACARDSTPGAHQP